MLGGQYLGMYAFLPEGSVIPPEPLPPVTGECTCESITVTYLVTADVQVAVTVESGERCPA